MIYGRYDRLEPLPSINLQTMSRLYLAFDVQDKRWVVLKLFKGDPSDALMDLKLRQMFDRETKIARNLQRDHILSATDSGTTNLQDLRTSLSQVMSMPDVHYFSSIQDKDDIPFLIYPYISDGSLSDFIDKTPSWQNWPLLLVGDLILQAASALQYMHTLNLVHWDVKPANFLVSYVGKPERIAYLYLCDFGISRVQKAKTEETTTAFGTINYMAPEQFLRKVRCESDQYTLAMMACYLLTGQYPLRSQAKDQLVWANIHLNYVPDKPSVLNPRRVQSERIDTIILKALSKAPEDRYSSIWLFAKTLMSAIKEQEHASHAATLAVQTPPALSEANFAPMPLHPPVNTSQYQIKVEPPQPIVARPVLSAEQNIWSSLPYTSLHKLAIYDDLPATPYSMCWSGQREKLACFFLGHAPLLLFQNGKRELSASIKTGYLGCWAVREDMLAVSSQQKKPESVITILDADATIAGTLSPQMIVNALDWSVDGLLAVWGESKKSIAVYALSQRSLREPEPKPQVISTGDMLCKGTGVLRWSPDGSLLAAGGVNGAVMCWHRDKVTNVHWHNSDFKATVQCVAWSRNGKLLAVAFKDRKVVVFDVQQDRIKTTWNNLPFVPRTLSFSTDTMLTVTSTKNYLLFGSVDNPTPTEKQHGQMLAVWSPDGSKLATLDETDDKRIVVWEK